MGHPKRADRRVPPWDPRHCEFRLVDAQGRERLEHFISAAYHEAYEARIASFMPQLAAIECAGELIAACGLRYASREPLFVETYFDEPIERELAAAAGETVGRGEIVEVGNLAIARPGGARQLIALLTEHLFARGDRWAVFTAVPALRNNFLALGIPFYALGPARPERLAAAARSAWGRYYDSGPQVIAVYVPDAAVAIERTP
jgi:hypothetical protein